jgi:hypothetical protein
MKKLVESGTMRICFENNVPALAPVSSVGTAAGDVFLSSETDTAVSPVTGFYPYFYFIDKFHGMDPLSMQRNLAGTNDERNPGRENEETVRLKRTRSPVFFYSPIVQRQRFHQSEKKV